MDRNTERRLLQIAIGTACLVPFLAGGAGVIEGPGMVKGVGGADLDSHYRYLSGLLLGIGIGFAACIPAIERRGAVFRSLGAIVAVGGFARLLSLISVGVPSQGHVFGLCMELGTVPLLMLWQWRVERRFGT